MSIEITDEQVRFFNKCLKELAVNRQWNYDDAVRQALSNAFGLTSKPQLKQLNAMHGLFTGEWHEFDVTNSDSFPPTEKSCGSSSIYVLAKCKSGESGKAYMSFLDGCFYDEDDEYIGEVTHWCELPTISEGE